MIGNMCNKTSYDIHFCMDDEKPFACELAAMGDFEGIHPYSGVTPHQDLKTWETFYYVASQLIDECTTLVATQGGKVIGIVNYMCASAYGTINYLYVLPNWRHHGVGSALLRNAESHMASASIRFSRVLVNLYEDSTMKFCKGMGYSVRQVIMKKRIKPLKEATAEASNSSPNGCDECGL